MQCNTARNVSAEERSFAYKTLQLMRVGSTNFLSYHGDQEVALQQHSLPIAARLSKSYQLQCKGSPDWLRTGWPKR